MQDPIKANKKKRYLCGLREVSRAFKTNKVKALVIAHNIERIESEDGLDDVVKQVNHSDPIFPYVTRHFLYITPDSFSQFANSCSTSHGSSRNGLTMVPTCPCDSSWWSARNLCQSSLRSRASSSRAHSNERPRPRLSPCSITTVPASGSLNSPRRRHSRARAGGSDGGGRDRPRRKSASSCTHTSARVPCS